MLILNQGEILHNWVNCYVSLILRMSLNGAFVLYGIDNDYTTLDLWLSYTGHSDATCLENSMFSTCKVATMPAGH